ncbi:MAG: rRNA pseudouridine synthase [Synergistaceae bacterium]|jgi:23S rRNA pseudouridine2605 synthase|nr:rRNA pseudouridine synthase [Synergistaceae bacterium]
MSEGKIGFPARLNRYIASCGVTSRRKADDLIKAGRVTVDGLPEASMGRVLAGGERVCVDGRDIAPAKHVYIVMNKPRGVLSAASDRLGETVVDLLPGHYRALGVFPVGRLDKESEGLIILTNDGAFAQEVIHPSSGVRRVYSVTLRLDLAQEGVDAWEGGLFIEGRLVRPLEVSPLDGVPGKRFRVVLGEGFKREIRLMAQALGNRVYSLRRTGIGNLSLRKLPVGAFNEYNYAEMKKMIHDGGEV